MGAYKCIRVSCVCGHARVHHVKARGQRWPLTLRCLLAKQTRPVGQDLSFSRVHTGSESVKEDTLFKA